jgi:hypothetical protein
MKIKVTQYQAIKLNLLNYHVAGRQILDSTKENLKGKYEIKCSVSILFYI